MNIEIIHVFNCDKSEGINLKTKNEADYWSDLVQGKTTGKRPSWEDLAYKSKNIKNFYKAIIKEPGTGYTFNVYFQDSDVEKQLDAERAKMLGGK